MTYVDTAGNWDRSGPIAAVIAIHAGLGFVLVSGLSAVVSRNIERGFTAIQFPTKPPDEAVEPPPKSEKRIEQRYSAPTPPLDIPYTSPTLTEPAALPKLDDVIIALPPGIGRDLVPTIGFDPIPPRPRNNPAEWVTTQDYPTAPLRREQEGLARFRLEIAASGAIESCTITRSSGFNQLDDATCRYVSRRAKFLPARDASDKPIAGHYESAVNWVIPD